MKKLMCIVRRPDIFHVLGLAESMKDYEQLWVVVHGLKHQSDEMVKSTEDLLIKLNKHFVTLKDYEVIRLLKEEHYDYAIRQNQWAHWGRLKSLHKYVKTLFTDYVTISNAMKNYTHEDWSISNNDYVSNCEYAFISHMENVKKPSPNSINSISYKAKGITLAPEYWPNDTDKLKVLLEFHLLLGQGDLLETAILDVQYDRVIKFLKNNEHCDIVINLHPDLYNKSIWLVDKLRKEIENLKHVTLSKEPMHTLGKGCDVIISDGISMLYESNLLNKPCAYVKHPEYSDLFSEQYKFLIENMDTYSYIDEVDPFNITPNPDREKINTFLLSGEDIASTL